MKLFAKQKYIDIENKYMDTKGGRGSRMDWKIATDIHIWTDMLTYKMDN